MHLWPSSANQSEKAVTRPPLLLLCTIMAERNQCISVYEFKKLKLTKNHLGKISKMMRAWPEKILMHGFSEGQIRRISCHQLIVK